MQIKCACAHNMYLKVHEPWRAVKIHVGKQPESVVEWQKWKNWDEIKMHTQDQGCPAWILWIITLFPPTLMTLFMCFSYLATGSVLLDHVACWVTCSLGGKSSIFSWGYAVTYQTTWKFPSKAGGSSRFWGVSKWTGVKKKYFLRRPESVFVNSSNKGAFNSHFKLK